MGYSLKGCCGIVGQRTLAGLGATATQELEQQKQALMAKLAANLAARKYLAAQLRSIVGAIPFVGASLAAGIPDDLLNLADNIGQYIPGDLGTQIRQLVADARALEAQLKAIEQQLAAAGGVPPLSLRYVDPLDLKVFQGRKLTEYIPHVPKGSFRKTVPSTNLTAPSKKWKIPTWAYPVAAIAVFGTGYLMMR